ncbi:hypothetical protein SLEP1_g19515 [Rubroshorea leprosula]|uniref:Uncharacterized protein n=1 Tax=Rubroshorea leprosula TaxID=152421 RepID=A0AAV5IZL7_9ROSI|nr:hypothetical protein SLEP1_g19515 [Rubroshorea leprosula]
MPSFKVVNLLQPLTTLQCVIPIQIREVRSYGTNPSSFSSCPQICLHLDGFPVSIPFHLRH